MLKFLENIDALKAQADAMFQPAKQWLGRLISELEFAGELNRLEGPESGRWSKLITKAHDLAVTAVKAGKVDRIKKAILEAEA